MAKPFLWATLIAVVLQTLASVFVYLASHHVIATDAAGLSTTGAEARRVAVRRYAAGLFAGIIVLLTVGGVVVAGLIAWTIPLALVGNPQRHQRLHRVGPNRCSDDTRHLAGRHSLDVEFGARDRKTWSDQVSATEFRPCAWPMVADVRILSTGGSARISGNSTDPVGRHTSVRRWGILGSASRLLP